MEQNGNFFSIWDVELSENSKQRILATFFSVLIMSLFRGGGISLIKKKKCRKYI